MSVWGWLACALGLLAVVVFLARRIETSLLYVADPERVAPESLGFDFDVKEVVVKARDGSDVLAWHSPAKLGAPTLLYFHGNAGSLANRAGIFARYAAEGIGVFMMTYRGYGGSAGTPSESRNVSDAKQAYEHLRGLGVSAEQIVLYGESLGSGVAVQVAAEKDVRGVILDAPYTSIVEVAKIHFPYLPARIFMWDRYQTMKFINRVTAPVLVIHGEADMVIPVAMGKAVAEAAGGPSEIKTFPHAGHSDHDQYGSFEAVLDWLRRLQAQSSKAALGAAAKGQRMAG